MSIDQETSPRTAWVWSIDCNLKRYRWPVDQTSEYDAHIYGNAHIRMRNEDLEIEQQDGALGEECDWTHEHTLGKENLHIIPGEPACWGVPLMTGIFEN